ncbi:MAG: aldose 1-epimerase family protein [Lachnospira sp.]|nr:aldose 1-epimerase family protein [Lachnospira sp.]
MEYILENEILKVTVASKGCEIISVMNKEIGKEYMWCGNPDAWKRHAPVLFPLIGRYKNDESVHEGDTYHMTQHGFARDMEFSLVEQTATSIKMKLVENEETKMKYPFNFDLILGYELNENVVKATYELRNTNASDMYFSIGGHPAFAAPAGNKGEAGDDTAAGCELIFEDENGAYTNRIQYGLLSSEGLLLDDLYDMSLSEGKTLITDDFFDKDALIIENDQCHKVSLMYYGKKFVTVEFDAPVFGIWSAAKKNVPFVCIEPWYGRTDRASFNGELKDREWGNTLKAGEVFDKAYRMIFA